jgi:cbb3-type cytochrome oxidase maturation protein
MRCDCARPVKNDMDILFLLIPISLIIMGIAIWVFLWAVRSGQFEDMEGPAHRILMDDDDPRIPRKPQLKDEDE